MKQIKDTSKIDEFILTPKQKKENAKIVDDLHIFGLRYADEISKLYQDKKLLVFPANYTPRERDLWKPLYAIAKIIDNENKTNTVNSILEYAKILRDELDKEKYKDVNLRLIKYLEILINEQIDNDLKEHWDWYKLNEIFAYLKDTGEFQEIKSTESLGRYLGKFELEKNRLSYGCISNKEKKTAYHITDEDIKKLK